MQIDLAPDMTELDRLTAAIEAFCHRHAVPARTVMHLTLVLEELFTNVVVHGFPQEGGSRAPIRLTMGASPKKVTVELIDSGQPFNPIDAPAPEIAAGLETRAIGGLGVHFLRSTMQDIWYDRRDECNHLGFSKAFS